MPKFPFSLIVCTRHFFFYTLIPPTHHSLYHCIRNWISILNIKPSNEKKNNNRKITKNCFLYIDQMVHIHNWNWQNLFYAHIHSATEIRTWMRKLSTTCQFSLSFILFLLLSLHVTISILFIFWRVAHFQFNPSIRQLYTGFYVCVFFFFLNKIQLSWDSMIFISILHKLLLIFPAFCTPFFSRFYLYRLFDSTILFGMCISEKEMRLQILLLFGIWNMTHTV